MIINIIINFAKQRKRIFKKIIKIDVIKIFSYGKYMLSFLKYLLKKKILFSDPDMIML